MSKSVARITSARDMDDWVPPIDPGIGVKDVFLRHLSVKPGSIVPFGAAVLRWDVDAPPTVRIKINDEFVDQVGSMVVQPATSTTYRVLALSGQRSTELGRAELSVNVAACVGSELLNPQSFLTAVLTAAIGAMDGMYTDGPQIVEFQPGRITFRLRLRKDVNNFYDPDVRIDASFGLRVEGGRLLSASEQVTANVSVPWYAWFTPFAFPALAIALDMARDTATAGGHAAIREMVKLLEFLWVPQPGMRRHSIRVGRDANGSGTIELTDCPNGPLDDLPGLSENPIVADQ